MKFCHVLCLQNLDLTKRKMVHEGPLSWKVNKEKTIGVYTSVYDNKVKKTIISDIFVD